VGGILYRQFLLDINELNTNPFISLDELKIYLSARRYDRMLWIG
jgi:hypothetical protein